MNLFAEALAWLADPANWAGPGGIPTRTLQHLGVTALALLVAAAIAIPAGVLIGHTRRGAALVGGFTGAARALPTLGLLTLFGLALGIGLAAPLLALIVLAIPSLLAGAYAGVQAVDPSVPAAAKAIGFTPAQVILGVELPLSLPVMIGGVRAAALQVVSTATLAAYTADLGLGRYLFAGLKSRDYAQMLGGALLVIALTLVLELLLAACQRAAVRYARPSGEPRRRAARASSAGPPRRTDPRPQTIDREEP
ncbi:ABC transporter permease [Leucobacter triazinivorans]|uniref:ABC transporter permease subunit n=1 Tax=Leucobacter triazinivorans TaxID=1784719 RepID=A0A4P6KD62_9MICO|nr:ABC transporter permease subunit [Leucobacter triazinivorans]QBE48142.1 ABC transporter permease subunit [Leucobacter triazinivorans]